MGSRRASVGIMHLETLNLVLDNSAAISLVMPDEQHHPDAIRLKHTIIEKNVIVPKLWKFEFANALNMGIKRQRISQEHVELFDAQMQLLDILEDSVDVSIATIISIAQQYKVTAYDATYLELAIRHKAVLASNDKQLKAAAITAGLITI
jgi:predicted nucleic acid-binding protein